MKYLGINLTKDLSFFSSVQNLDTEDYKKCWDKLRKTCINGPCSWVGRLNIINMLVLPKLIYRFDPIPVGSFVVEIDKKILKFIWKCKRPRIAKATQQKHNKVAGLILPDFKNHYRTSLVVQWLRIHLPMQETQVQALPGRSHMPQSN